jgi:hypothetical protein
MDQSFLLVLLVRDAGFAVAAAAGHPACGGGCRGRKDAFPHDSGPGLTTSGFIRDKAGGKAQPPKGETEMKLILASAAIALAIAAPAAAAEPDYVTIVLTKEVNATPAHTWAKVGPFCAIQEWFKVPCSIASGDGKGVGTVRNLKRDTTTIVEIMVAQTPYSYTYTQPTTTILYHGTIAAEPLDGGKRTKLVYTLFYDAASLETPEKKAADRESRSKRFNDGLDAMKAMAEAN